MDNIGALDRALQAEQESVLNSMAHVKTGCVVAYISQEPLVETSTRSSATIPLCYGQYILIIYSSSSLTIIFYEVFCLSL